MSTHNSYERYQRQIILKEFGEAAQEKLLQARVLVVGAGGLGCPTLQYLAAAGIGTIGIIDDDIVSLSNLQRQTLYTVDDIGQLKAEKAAEVLRQINPEIQIIAYPFRLTVKNAFAIFNSFDIIIDGSDNFSTRYLVNDAAVLLGKPLVYGAVSRYEGQLAIFNAGIFNAGTASVNYRDLFPKPPQDGQVLNCAETGVLGILPGIIGTMQAGETIKYITGIGNPLVNRLLTYNALNNQIYEINLQASPTTRSLIPADEAEFEKMDYDWLCGVQVPTEQEITSTFFNTLIADKNVTIIDVREQGETPLVKEFMHQHIPLNKLDQDSLAGENDTIVLFCQSGQRSLQAATFLSGIFGDRKKIYSLRGGIVSWKHFRTKQIV